MGGKYGRREVGAGVQCNQSDERDSQRLHDFYTSTTPNEVRTLAQRPGIAYERAPRKFYSLPAAASSRQYRLFRPAILRGA